MKTRYLTVEEVILAHDIIMMKYGGGGTGVRDESGLEAAVYRPQAEHFGVEVHPAFWRKAAVLTQSLIQGHYFHDGNKRTAYAALEVFTRLNGYILTVSNEEAENTMVQIASEDSFAGEEGLDSLSQLLESWCMKQEKDKKDS
ncbi:type II toxin-antitoxin system death-on-curing family toxin [Desmospora profundinema]|uniref:Death-on-curing protein n=1 Tax=Desmospora profundinema TaxID=1571184 RepID=A0ABU1IS73_9BACL|nr:type II toxin-antitoxin system death-on-curing family toxin [Desmospora profundinema]MDR6227034.1 death-on-curing protein [Desmospora profundinema]